MGIIAKVGAALQQLLGMCAEEAAQSTGVIVRKRKFTGISLARTFVLGFLRNPEASAEDLAQIAVQCGADVTPQAIDQRHTPKLSVATQDNRQTVAPRRHTDSLSPRPQAGEKLTGGDNRQGGTPGSLRSDRSRHGEAKSHWIRYNSVTVHLPKFVWDRRGP